MEIVKFIAGLILGLFSGSFFVSIPIFLLIRRPFLKKLDRLGFLTGRQAFYIVDRVAFLYFLTVCALTSLVAFVDFFQWLPYLVGASIILLSNVPRVLNGMLNGQTRTEFERDSSKFLLPGWEWVPSKKHTHCLNQNCGARIPQSLFGIMEYPDSLSSSFPKAGEFGCCSEDCFNERAQAKKAVLNHRYGDAPSE